MVSLMMWSEHELIESPERLSWQSTRDEADDTCFSSAEERHQKTDPAPDTEQGGRKIDRKTISDVFLIQFPAMILAMQAAGVFDEQTENPRRIHEIETYGPIGFDFAEHQEGPGHHAVPLAPGLLEAVYDGEIDIELALAAYGADSLVEHAPSQHDTAWLTQDVYEIGYDRIDHMDLSFGVVEFIDHHHADELIIPLPIVDDFFV